MTCKTPESGILRARAQGEKEHVKSSPEAKLTAYVLQEVRKSLEVQQIVYGEIDEEQVLEAVEKNVSAMENIYMKKLELLASRNAYLAKELSKVQGRIIASPQTHESAYEWLKSPQATPPSSTRSMASQSNLGTPTHFAPLPEIPRWPLSDCHDEPVLWQMTSVSKQSSGLQSPLRKGSLEMSPIMPPVPEEVDSAVELPLAMEQMVRPQDTPKIIQQCNVKQLTTLEIGHLDTAADAGEECDSSISGAPLPLSGQKKKFYDI